MRSETPLYGFFGDNHNGHFLSYGGRMGFIRFWAIFILLTLTCATANADIRWRTCDLAPTLNPASEKVRLECARLAVPMTYDHHGNGTHDQRKIHLQLHRIPARGERLGTLLLISGGPGESSALRYVPIDRLPQKIREHFDLLAYDPRGIGESSPNIRCNDDPLISAQAFVDSCIAQTRDFLPHIGTFEAAHDIEHIRRALGEEQLNIIGYSYGSKVAMRYALHHPQGVRALVLDGVINPHLPYYHWQARQQRGYQQAAERFLAACRHAPDCPFAHAQADAHMLRPLMLERAVLEKAEIQKKTDNPFLGLLEKTGLRDRTIPTDLELMEVFMLGLTQEEYWPHLAQTMSDFLNDKPDIFRKQFGAMMGDTAHLVPLITVTCADIAEREGEGSAIIMLRHLDLISPWDNHHLPYRPPEAWPCAHWPYIGSDYRHPLPELPSALPQILLVTREHDPATPRQNAREMADWLRAPLLTVAGNGHIAALTGISACADDAILDYLLHPDKPQHDQRCFTGPHPQILTPVLWLLGAACLWWLWRRKKKRKTQETP